MAHIVVGANRGVSRTVLAAFVGLGLAGCDAGIPEEESSAGGEEFKKLAEVRAENGNRVEFFEPLPGTYFVIEHGSQKSPIVTRGDEWQALGPVAMYEKLAPGALVPEPLLASQRQFDAMKPRVAGPGREGTAVLSRDTVTVPALDGAAITQPLTSAQFADKHCRCTWGESFVCWRSVTGYGSQRVDDVNFYDGNINAVRGQIRLVFSVRTWWSWSHKASVDVAAGEEKFFHYGTAVLDYDAFAEIANAVGDNYHYNGVGYNGPRTGCR